MLSLEQEIRNKLEDLNVSFYDYTKSKVFPDFKIFFPAGDNLPRSFWLDAKEKRQHINLSNWVKTDVPEEHLFIIDELSIKRLASAGLYSGVLIRTADPLNYYFFSILDFFFVEKIRVNRQASPTSLKGKWMMDLRLHEPIDTITDAIIASHTYIKDLVKILEKSECIGSVPLGGVPRTSEHKYIDYISTR